MRRFVLGLSILFPAVAMSAAPFIAAPVTVGSIPVQLCPTEAVASGSPHLVTFGLPLPRGSLPSAHRMAHLLRDKGISHELDVWGHDVSHDWPWWRKQLAHHLPRFC